MRIHLHDFSGHPFQAQLSRALAERGNEVMHTFSAQYASGKGDLERHDADAEGLRFEPIDAGVPFLKYSPLGRLRFEIAHARALDGFINAHRPDVLVACNIPLIALRRVAAFTQRKGLPWVLWHQDIFSEAMADELAKRLPAFATVPTSATLQRIERVIVSSADRAVVIGEEFVNKYRSWGIDLGKVTVLPNWAPVDEISPRARDNEWASVHLPATHRYRMLYAGTLGRKHNPQLLLDLLEAVRSRGLDVELVVVSEGDGAADLAASIADRVAPARVMGFQSASDLPEVLGSADVLVTLLEPDASRYSIPSKVLSYLAAGRPVLGMMPADNPASLDIKVAGGMVETPDEGGVERAAEWLVQLAQDPDRADRIGIRSRQLVEERSDIRQISGAFERILGEAVMARRAAAS